MPVTRSAKDVPVRLRSTEVSTAGEPCSHTDQRRTSTETEQRVDPGEASSTRTDATTETEMTTSTGTEATATTSTGTEATATTSGTEATAKTSSSRATAATSASGATAALRSKYATITATVPTTKNVATSRQRTDPVEMKTASAMTLVPVRTSERSKSKKSTSTTARRRLKAKEELARYEFEQAQAAANLARVRLEMAELESAEEDSVEEEDEDKTTHIHNWIQTSIIEEREHVCNQREEPMASKPQEERLGGSTDVKILAEALKQAIATRECPAPPPKYIHELPFFDGNSSEWVAFRVVYEDTASMFSAAQNMARLRRAIKGHAREAIKSLLYSDTPPEEIMQALRRRYGRPDVLVLSELEKVKALPKISENPRDICIFASQVNNSVAAIKGLKKPQYLHSPEIVKSIVEKMPTILKFKWYDFTAKIEDGDYSSLSLISTFLNQEADKCGSFATLEDRGHKKTSFRHTAYAASENSLKPSNDGREKICPHCQGGHSLFECQPFQKMAVQERWEAVKKHRLCFKCLQTRHRKDNCKRPPCKICKRWHHNLLHAEYSRKQEPPDKETFEDRSAAHNITTDIASPVNVLKTSRAYLKMVPVEVYGPKGSQKVLALLDEGSTVSLLDTEVAEKIGANGKMEELILQTVGGKLIKKSDSKKMDLKIKGVHEDEKKKIYGVRTVDELKLSPQTIERERIESCPHLKKIANILHYEPEAPKLLIGQDNWELIVSRRTQKGRPRQPVASLTELGWVLHGFDSGGAKEVHFLNSCFHVETAEEKMHEIIKEHFSIDALGVQPRRPTNDLEGKALNLLEKTCRRLPDGRFEAGLLWRQEDEQMPESYTSAERRLNGIEKKMDKDPHLKIEYRKQMQHLLDNGYAEEAPAESKSEKKWYLPHFAVTHPVKKKIRIVFDAAAKSHGRSLNDALLPGPDLLQSLFGVLLRFRQGPLAVAADIKEMFLQIRIRPEDRDSLRFLWREERDAPIKEYRMTSVIFGASSSPSTAIFVKNRNAVDYEQGYPEAAKAIERNHYMDDYLHSFHSEDQLHRITEEVDFIHKKAGFELRGWATNRSHLLRNKEVNQKKEVDLGEKEEKTLGLRWLTEKDSLAFRTSLRNTPEEVVANVRRPTKREVTSAVMSTFDPLGLASPVLIQGKRLLQAIWRSGIGWDDAVEENEFEVWKSYQRSLDQLKNLHVPRCIAPHNTEGELHVFTDASEMAFAAAVYWRTRREDGSYLTSLVAGKARVSPLKPVSVPRLELQAALLGSRLARSVEQELDLEAKSKTFWTDSSVVLSWIKSDPRTFKTFVAHRLAEIEELTKPQEWRWVPTSQNPADDATRAVPENFNKEHRWFTGPDFLKKEEIHWPAPRSFRKEKTGEERETAITAVVMSASESSLPDPERFSSWKRLWRTTARVLQFIQLCRTPKNPVNVSRRLEKEDPTWRRQKNSRNRSKPTQKRVSAEKNVTSFIPIEASLLERAEQLLLQKGQAESFHEDIQRIQKGRPLESNSKLRKLDVEMDGNLLRLRGRIGAARGVTASYKRPILLDSKNKISRLLIEDYHKRFNHGNHATVMNEIRQRFLILGLRSAIRSTQHQCQWCKVRKSKPQEVPTGDLPPERLRHGAHPFTCTGVDYFGPMSVTVARRHEKRWGALFTCLTTRAVHIELVPSLSTDSMIMALRRFSARRGMPQTVYSDNGTNFVGANKELKEALIALKKEEMASEAEKIGVRWKYIPAGAPSMGGSWERLVGSIKRALGATLNERHPHEEVLLTLLLEAEHVVNSRPLTNLADNPDEEALTPNHFLIGRSSGSARIGVFTNRDTVGKETWKTTQRLTDHFWQRWLKEYLPTLLPRKIHGRAGAADLQVGDTVMIVDSSLPRCTWPRGRITQVYPGPDGRTRIVDVATRSGILRRPSSRVVVLVPGELPSQEMGASHEGETVGNRDRASSVAPPSPAP